MPRGRDARGTPAPRRCPAGTPNAPRPGPPLGLDVMVSGDPSPPFPPPPLPGAPFSGRKVVPRVTTPLLLTPESSMLPKIWTVPVARIVSGLGPWATKRAPVPMRTLRTSITPPVATCCFVGANPGPPTSTLLVVSKTKTWLGGTSQSKSPPLPPVPLKPTLASSRPSRHWAGSSANCTCVSWKVSSRKSSCTASASGLGALVLAGAKASCTTSVASPVRSAKPTVIRARNVVAGGSTPTGSIFTNAPEPPQFSTRLTSVVNACQTPAPSRYSQRSRSEEMFSTCGPTGWSRASISATEVLGLLSKLSSSNEAFSSVTTPLAERSKYNRFPPPINTCVALISAEPTSAHHRTGRPCDGVQEQPPRVRRIGGAEAAGHGRAQGRTGTRAHCRARGRVDAGNAHSVDRTRFQTNVRQVASERAARLEHDRACILEEVLADRGTAAELTYGDRVGVDRGEVDVLGEAHAQRSVELPATPIADVDRLDFEAAGRVRGDRDESQREDEKCAKKAPEARVSHGYFQLCGCVVLPNNLL